MAIAIGLSSPSGVRSGVSVAERFSGICEAPEGLPKLTILNGLDIVHDSAVRYRLWYFDGKVAGTTPLNLPMTEETRKATTRDVSRLTDTCL